MNHVHYFWWKTNTLPKKKKGLEKEVFDFIQFNEHE